MSGQALLDELIERLQKEKQLSLRTTYEREVIARNMLMQHQPEVKKGIVPYKMAKKRQEGGYVLPDGSIIDNVTMLLKESISKTFHDDEDEEAQSLLKELVVCIEQECDIDSRESMRKNVVLAGGTSAVPFFDELFNNNVLG